VLRQTREEVDDTAPDSPAARGLTASDLRGLLVTLGSHRPVFHSERDFQHALAWQVHLHHPDAAIRLETRPLPAKPVFLDLAITVAGHRAAIELKYLVRALTATVNGEQFKLRDQAAQDLGRYDSVKDIARLEELVAARAADVGYAVVLSNDPLYWQPSKKPSPADAAFRLDEGRTLTRVAHLGHGRRCWHHAHPRGNHQSRRPLPARLVRLQQSRRRSSEPVPLPSPQGHHTCRGVIAPVTTTPTRAA
jgi:hypothetical protein